MGLLEAANLSHYISDYWTTDEAQKPAIPDEKSVKRGKRISENRNVKAYGGVCWAPPERAARLTMSRNSWDRQPLVL